MRLPGLRLDGSRHPAPQRCASLWRKDEPSGSQPQPPLAHFPPPLTGSQLPVAMVPIERQQVKEGGGGGGILQLRLLLCEQKGKNKQTKKKTLRRPSMRTLQHYSRVFGCLDLRLTTAFTFTRFGLLNVVDRITREGRVQRVQTVG